MISNGMDTMRRENQIPKGQKRRFTREVIFLVLIIFLIGYFLCGDRIWFYFQTEGYQSVFLNNGQVYFGKLGVSGSWLKLSDIYYLQANQSLQQTASGGEINDSGQNIELVKLGSELHGPTDTMYIERDKVMFWENLKEDSKVVDAINKYQVK
jgi:hypothetical protein